MTAQIRVRNGGIYAIEVRRSEADEWRPWSTSPLRELVDEVRSNWARDRLHRRPFLGDMPSGIYDVIGEAPERRAVRR